MKNLVLASASGALFVACLVVGVACGSSDSDGDGAGATGGSSGTGGTDGTGETGGAGTGGANAGGASAGGADAGGSGGSAGLCADECTAVCKGSGPESAGCQSCVDDAIKADHCPLTRCNADSGGAKCQTYRTCANKCSAGDSACEKACEAANATGYQELESDLFDCACGASDGAPVCGSGFQVTTQTCADCLGTNCCDEFTACHADETCVACVTNKSNEGCAASSTAQAAEACTTSKCAKECAIGGAAGAAGAGGASR